MKTFAYDHTLPALPLASPGALCSAIPALAAPLLDEATLAVTLAGLSEFVKPGGDAEKLHQALLDYKASLSGNASWLRSFWDDSYLEWRAPLPLNLNYCFQLGGPGRNRGTELENFLLRIARAAALLGRGELEAEQNRSGPLAMDQARSQFYTRLPSPSADILRPVDLTAPLTMTVLCRGYCFLLYLADGEHRLPEPAALATALADIRRKAEELAVSSPPSWLGAMTTAPREQAAALRAALRQDPANRLGLDALERSLLVLCLDPAEASEERLAHLLLAGPAENRWFDKSLQVIATEDGKYGLNLEHAGCDAGVWAWLLHTAALLPDAAAGTQDFMPRHKLVEWRIPEALCIEIKGLAECFKARASEIDLARASFPELSRDALKAMRTSPDAFLQVSFQLAQYKVFGELRSSYEAVSMRSYAGGRTECARGSTRAALSLAVAMATEDPGALRELYRKAERAHLGRLVACQRGQAVERYVYGLEMMYRLFGENLGIVSSPAFFSDPGWKKIRHDSLSTSGMAAEGIRAFAFAPVVADGFGIGYVPGSDSTVITATSFRQSGLAARDFTGAFAESAGRLAGLLR